ncbi:hypothetical protein ZWY2020_004135 [Hordeum vulgare]|nr:hypothetical protein ZWY2020_004135 [Hordeum vulgare]
MEPMVHDRPTFRDIHYPMVPDQNSLVCLFYISPPKFGFLRCLTRVIRQFLGICVVRFSGSSTGTVFVVLQHDAEQVAAMQDIPIVVRNRCVWIVSHNEGDNAFTFSFRHVVNLSLEKMSLDLWNRRGVVASITGFAILMRVEHTCIRDSVFLSIFVLVKVEALQHIPHHLAFHRVDGNVIYADVIINGIWYVSRSLGAPTSPSLPSGRHNGSAGGLRSAAPPRQGHAHPRASRAAHGPPEGGTSMAD